MKNIDCYTFYVYNLPYVFSFFQKAVSAGYMYNESEVRYLLVILILTHQCSDYQYSAEKCK